MSHWRRPRRILSILLHQRKHERRFGVYMKHPSFRSALTILLPLQVSEAKVCSSAQHLQIKTVISKVSQMVVRGSVQSEPRVWIQRKTSLLIHQQFTATYCARLLIRDKEFKVYRILISAIMSRILRSEREETFVKKWVKWVWAFPYHFPILIPHNRSTARYIMEGSREAIKICGSVSTGTWEGEGMGDGRDPSGRQIHLNSREYACWHLRGQGTGSGGPEVANWMINWLYWLK